MIFPKESRETPNTRFNLCIGKYICGGFSGVLDGLTTLSTVQNRGERICTSGYLNLMYLVEKAEAAYPVLKD